MKPQKLRTPARKASLPPTTLPPKVAKSQPGPVRLGIWRAAVLEETHTFSPSVVNTLRVALNKTNGKTNNYYDFAAQAVNPQAADTSLNMLPGVPGHGAPLINLASTGITQPSQLWGGTHQDLFNQIFQIYDDSFVTRGTRAGAVQYRAGRLDAEAAASTRSALVPVRISDAPPMVRPAMGRVKTAKPRRGGVIDIDLGHARVRQIGMKKHYTC